jgi:hypothetical protein
MGVPKTIHVVFVERGKTRHGLSAMLQKLGVQLSRVYRGRGSDTGAR